jgi:hypothetical protein
MSQIKFHIAYIQNVLQYYSSVDYFNLYVFRHETGRQNNLESNGSNRTQLASVTVGSRINSLTLRKARCLWGLLLLIFLPFLINKHCWLLLWSTWAAIVDSLLSERKTTNSTYVDFIIPEHFAHPEEKWRNSVSMGYYWPYIQTNCW